MLYCVLREGHHSLFPLQEILLLDVGFGQWLGGEDESVLVPAWSSVSFADFSHNTIGIIDESVVSLGERERERDRDRDRESKQAWRLLTTTGQLLSSDAFLLWKSRKQWVLVSLGPQLGSKGIARQAESILNKRISLSYVSMHPLHNECLHASACSTDSLC